MRQRALLGLVATWWVAMNAYVLLRYFNFQTSVFDLGIHDQMTWLLSQGRPAFLSTRGLDAMADHFSAIAYLLAPLYWVVSSPLTLLLVQTTLLASGALPLYSLGERATGSSRLALGLSAAYLLQPGLHWICRFDVHFNVLCIPFFLFAFDFLERGAAVGYGLALALAMTTGEFVGFSVVLMGWNAYRARGRGWGAATLALGAAGLGLARLSLLAHNHGEASQYLSLYTNWRESLPALLDLRYLLLLMLPWGGLPLLSPGRLLPIVPIVAGNLLSWRSPQHGIEYQYLAGILPFLAWAAVDGAHRLMARAGQPREGPAAPPALALGLGLLLGWGLGPFTPWVPSEVRPGSAALRRALAEIPPADSVSAENNPGSHLAERSELYRFPAPFARVAWGNRSQALAEQSGRGFDPPSPGAMRRSLEATSVRWLVLAPGWPQAPLEAGDRWILSQAIRDAATFGPVRSGPDFVLLRRGEPAQAGPWPEYALEAGAPRPTLEPAPSPFERRAHRFNRGEESRLDLTPALRGSFAGRRTDAPLVYGPYLELMPGLYRVSFELGPSRPGTRCQGVAEVTADSGSLQLWQGDFQVDGRQRVTGSFTLPTRQVVEARVNLSRVRGPGQLRVHGVQLQRSSASQEELSAAAGLEQARQDYAQEAPRFEREETPALSLMGGLSGKGLEPLRGPAGEFAWRLTAPHERSVWGPYLSLSPGAYEVTFRLGAVPEDGVEVVLDVATRQGNQVVWASHETLLGPSARVSGRFTVKTGDRQPFETRIWAGRAPFTLEGVDLRRLKY